MIKIKDIIENLELGKVYTDKDRPPFQAESVNEEYGDLNDDGFKKVEKYNKIVVKLVKKLENAVRHSEGKDAVKWIRGLYDAAGIMYDTIGHKMYYESDLGLTYKKGKTVKVKHKTSGKSIVITDKPAVIKKYEKLGFYAESVNESRANVKKAIAIAKKMSGNMTGAVKKIEKIQRGLSKQVEVEDALRKANESVNEANQTAMYTQTFDKLLKKQTKGKLPTLKDFDRVFDLMRKRYKELDSRKYESVNEVQKRQATDIAVKFDKAYLNFSREIRDIIKMVVKITGNNTDGKIFNSAYKKHLIPFDALFKSWYKGQQNNPHISEKVARPFSEHLRKAQDEIEYMISNGPAPDGDDSVYDKPKEAMKLLQIAQKSLGKIK